ncbi:MAG: chromosomal replication initiator protein DnaA [Muribaculaceae bacterium]|nr:chromosomal replication initiator protein DnaA [Muribaculaceae bacterium]
MNEAALKKWSACLAEVKKALKNDTAFNTWFATIEPKSMRGNRLTLVLPSMFCRELLEGEYAGVFTQGLTKGFGEVPLITYMIPVVNNKGGSITIQNQPLPTPQPETQAPKEEPKKRAKALKVEVPPLNASLSFENFCVSSCNKLPWTIAESIARNPVNSIFNPFFLYGDVGVGKTHLMQAIGLHVKQAFPDKRVAFLPMKEFQRLYQNAYLEGDIPGLLRNLMQCDVLLFDDLQEITGSKSTLNNALFPLFNHLHQHGRQMVFTCDRPPQDLEGLEDRLIDRFKWGVTEKLERPDTALRKKILTFKARKNGLDLPQDVIDFIAAAPLNSVREIEGIVIGIMTRAISLGREIDLSLAEEVVDRAVKSTRQRNLNFDMIVEAVAEKYRLNSDVLFTKSRVKDVAEARMVVMYLASKLLKLSSGSIGRKIGRKHSTVMHGISTIETRMAADSSFRREINDIQI